jgi:hypothetical protein
MIPLRQVTSRPTDISANPGGKRVKFGAHSTEPDSLIYHFIELHN